MPDSDVWQEPVTVAEDNGFFWAHEFTVPENSYTETVSGNYKQLDAEGSGFKFHIETTADVGEELRPAIGFQSFFSFTRDNFENYDDFAETLKTGADSGDIMYYEGWYIPDPSVLTGAGLYIYSDVNGTVQDITDRFSYGMSIVEDEENPANDMIFLSYGAVMVDGEFGFDGVALPVSTEDELIWSDEDLDGNITGEWWIVYDSSFMAGGDGTEGNPYKIETAEQLNRVRYALDKHYILTDDISLSGYDNWNPIGAYVIYDPEDEEAPDPEKAFTGTFDGDGFTISDVTSYHPETEGVGLFGCIFGEEAKVYDLNVENVDIAGAFLVGGLVGYAVDCTLESVDLIGTNKIQGWQMNGGLVGGGFSVISKCNADADIVVLGDGGGSTGILTGGMENSVITDCTATGTVTADGDDCYGLGGLLGCAFENSYVENCTAENVKIESAGSGTTLIGGLIGYVGSDDEDNPTEIENCDVIGLEIEISDSTSRVGGILGGGFYLEAFAEYFPNPALYKITDCSAAGTISGGLDAIGSIAGHSYNSPVEDCDGSGMTWTDGELNEIGTIQT